jgi:choline dehydrogenase-like flavoprotein
VLLTADRRRQTAVVGHVQWGKSAIRNPKSEIFPVSAVKYFLPSSTMSKDSKLNRRSFLASLGSMLAALSVPKMGLTGEADRAPGQGPRAGRFGDIDDNTVFDVCIIGSGFAGAVLGEALVRQGIKTAILESGPGVRGTSIDPRFHQLDTYRSGGPIAYPLAGSRYRGLGGTSLLWGGMCPRLQPIDFEKNSYTPAGASWPINYKDLEPYYGQAEQALRVRGGKRSRYHPPINRDYSIPSDRSVTPLESLLMDAGVIISDIPFSTSIDRGHSFLSDRFGPYLRMIDSHLPAFQKSDHGSLISGITATRLDADDTGTIRGVEVRDLDRNIKNLRAHIYVVACGGLESPRLLLLSRLDAFPNGIGNNHDLVGRFFMEHRPAPFRGRVRLGWQTFSLIQLKADSQQYYEEFKRLGMGGMSLGFDLEGAIDGQRIRSGEIGEAFTRLHSRNLEITAGTEMKPVPENRLTLDPKAKDYFGNPGAVLFLSESDEDRRTVARGKKIVQKIFAELGVKDVEELPRIIWSHHHMGTCRMGDNPRTSVVDRNLRVHGTTNLFVAGSSVFVTSGTANPTLTLTALSIRLAEHMGSQLRSGTVPLTSRRSKEK